VPVRKPPTDVHLVDFLAGVFAVLAMRGTTRLRAEPGVLDTALHETLKALVPVAEKLRVRPRFRITSTALGRSSSNLSRALRQLETEGVIERSGGDLLVRLTPTEAYVDLEALPFPLGFAERAAKALVRRHAIARIRHARRAHGDQGSGGSPPSPTTL